jgi:hypothetical protein
MLLQDWFVLFSRHSTGSLICRLDVALESVPWENIPEGVSGAGLSQSSGKPHEMESVYFGLEIKVIFLLIGERSSG